MKAVRVETAKPVQAVRLAEGTVYRKGFSPYIENGTWWVFDDEHQVYVDTGIAAMQGGGLEIRDGLLHCVFQEV